MSPTVSANLSQLKNMADDQKNRASTLIPSPEPMVAILMCTLNAQPFLEEQLKSIYNQTHQNWHLYISDDGSTDETIAIIERYAKADLENKITLTKGPQQGFSCNFLSLTKNENIVADYYAFCDQDDIWYTDKIARALKILETYPANTLALYCSRTCLITQDGEFLGYSKLFKRPPSFENAVVQNIAAGNTIVFNNATRVMLLKCPCEDIPAHDWWLYIMVTGCDGIVHYDPIPSLDYRQHPNNTLGRNTSWKGAKKRATQLLSGSLAIWIKKHGVAINKLGEAITMKNQIKMTQLCQLHKNNTINRALKMYNLGIYRQHLGGNIGLYLAVLLNKI